MKDSKTICDEIRHTLSNIKKYLEKYEDGYLHASPIYKQKRILSKFLEKYSNELKSDELNIKDIIETKDSNDYNLYLKVIYGYGKFSIENCKDISEGYSLPVKYLYSFSDVKNISSDKTIYDFEKILINIKNKLE